MIRDHLEVVELLLEHGAAVDIESKEDLNLVPSYYLQTSLHCVQVYINVCFTMQILIRSG